MAQHDMNIANQSFPSFRSDLNNALSAIQTNHSGTSRPTGAVAGQLWLDTTSATAPILKLYDGADDISIATFNYTNNTVDILDSTLSTPLSVTGNSTAGAEIRLPEDTDNGSNYVALKAPDNLASNLTLTLPTADGTSNQALVTNGSGTLSFATVGVTGVTSTATGTVLTLSDTANTTSQNLIVDNQKEIRFRETTANGTNYVGFKAPASLTVDKTYILPSADGTSGQALVTDGSGTLSFSTVAPNYASVSASIIPTTTATYDLGSSSKVWANIYTGDLNLSNENRLSGNNVDGTKGSWTIQEGNDNLFILNNKTGKKYKFKLEEI